MIDPRAALAEVLYDVMYDCGDPAYAECTLRGLAERGVLLVTEPALTTILTRLRWWDHCGHKDAADGWTTPKLAAAIFAALSGEVTA